MCPFLHKHINLKQTPLFSIPQMILTISKAAANSDINRAAIPNISKLEKSGTNSCFIMFVRPHVDSQLSVEQRSSH